MEDTDMEVMAGTEGAGEGMIEDTGALPLLGETTEATEPEAVRMGASAGDQ